MNPEIPDLLSPGRCLLLGLASGLLAHAAPILFGRLGLETLAFLWLLTFFAGAPFLSGPVAWFARRGRVGPRQALLAGGTSGLTSAIVVVASLTIRGRGLDDAPYTLVYPVYTCLLALGAARVARPS